MLAGLASRFTATESIPALVCEPKAAHTLPGRLDEILEDAYLLKASKLRTFFSPDANWAALKRDLRQTLEWIAENREWANGVVRLGTQTIGLPSVPLETAFELLGQVGVDPPFRVPALIYLDDYGWHAGATVIQIKYPGAVAVYPSLDVA